MGSTFKSLEIGWFDAGHDQSHIENLPATSAGHLFAYHERLTTVIPPKFGLFPSISCIEPSKFGVESYVGWYTSPVLVAQTPGRLEYPHCKEWRDLCERERCDRWDQLAWLKSNGKRKEVCPKMWGLASLYMSHVARDFKDGRNR